MTQLLSKGLNRSMLFTKPNPLVKSNESSVSNSHLLKVIHVVSNLDNSFGGPAQSVPYLSKYLIEQGVDSRLLSVQIQANESNDVIQKYNLPHVKIPSLFGRRLYYSPKFKRSLRSKGEIIHLHSIWTYPGYCSWKVHKQEGNPLVCSLRSNLYKASLERSSKKKSLAMRLFARDMLKNANCLHATEEGEIDAVRRLGIRSPVALIPNGIDLNLFKGMPIRTEAKKAIDLKDEKRYALFLSRIHPRKGLDKLINAFIKIADENNEWNLLIVGPEQDEDYAKRQKEKVRNAGLEDRVIFKGQLLGTDKLYAYASSELFVLPTQFENFGLVIGEALAAGKPVLTTVNTPWSQIEEKNCGWRINPDSNDLIQAIQSAFSLSTETLDCMGNQGKDIVRQYSWDEQAEKMIQVYRWIKGFDACPDFVDK